MLQTQLLRHVRRHGRRAVALAGMVAAGDVGHAHLAGVVGLRLRNLAGDEHIGPGGDGSFKIALRATGAPCYIFNSCLSIRYLDYWPI